MRLETINNNTDFKEENIVTNPNTLNKDGEFSDDGVFSEVIFGKLTSEYEYSCKCGNLKGKYFDGYVCDKCGTKVEKCEAAIDRSGWIDLQGNYIINYVFYRMIEKIIGNKLDDILKYDPALDADGNPVIVEDPNNPYAKYGLVKFKENFDEILNYFYDKRNNSKLLDTFSYVMANKDKVFIDKIPVMSAVLRPAVMVQGTLKVDKINIVYSNILKENKALNNKQKGERLDIIVLASLYRIQNMFLELCEDVLTAIKGKTGFIRNSMCGSRLNFTARNIITPASPNIKINECAMSYSCFHELYKYELINLIKFVKNITYMEAERVWFRSKLAFDEEVYQIMLKMINDNDVRILLNRNPTINFGSIICLRVAEVKHDFNDNTLSLSNQV